MSQNRLLAIILCLVTCNYYILPDAASILCPLYKSHWRPKSAFLSDSMKGLLFDDLGFGVAYTERTNDGLKLLKENNLTNRRITAFDYTIPFSFALRSPPPVGAPPYWLESADVARTSYPDQNKVFRGVDIVMIPKSPDDQATTSVLQDVYGNYLKNNFVFLAESPYWIILTRK